MLQRAYLHSKGHSGEAHGSGWDNTVLATKDRQTKSLEFYLCKLIQAWPSFTQTLNLATWKNLKIGTNDTRVSLPAQQDWAKRVSAWMWPKPWVNGGGSLTTVCKCVFTCLSSGSWGVCQELDMPPQGFSRDLIRFLNFAPVWDSAALLCLNFHHPWLKKKVLLFKEFSENILAFLESS